jgi:hypothetical protein
MPKMTDTRRKKIQARQRRARAILRREKRQRGGHKGVRRLKTATTSIVPEAANINAG